jgi:hypothetical protein
MKVIFEKVINDKLAQLVLCDDNITVNTLYDGVCVNSSSENTYNNIKDEKWIQEAILDLEVNCVLRKNNVNDEIQSMIDALD